YIISILIYLLSFCFSPLNLSGNNILTKYFLDYNIFFALGIFLYFNFNTILNYRFFNKKKHFYFSSILLIISMVIIKYFLGEYNKITSILASLFSILLIIFF